MEKRKDPGWALPIAIVAVVSLVLRELGVENSVVYIIVLIAVLGIVKSLGGYR